MSMNHYKPGKIYDTKNYGQFKLAQNRPVDLKRVDKLKKKIQAKDYGQSFPILVDKNGTIRDGQHRFSARKDLNLPIYFMMAEQKLDLKAVAETNSMQKGWNTDDHVFARANAGDKNFKAIENFAAENGLKPSQVLSFFRGDKTSDFRKKILSGEVIQVNSQLIAEAQRVLNIWKSFRHYIPKMDYRSAVAACKKLVKTREYDHNRMINQINKNPRKFVPCTSTEMYLEMFEEIYNYEFHRKNRLSLTEK